MVKVGPWGVVSCVSHTVYMTNCCIKYTAAAASYYMIWNGYHDMRCCQTYRTSTWIGSDSTGDEYCITNKLPTQVSLQRQRGDDYRSRFSSDNPGPASTVGVQRGDDYRSRFSRDNPGPASTVGKRQNNSSSRSRSRIVTREAGTVNHLPVDVVNFLCWEFIYDTRYQLRHANPGGSTVGLTAMSRLLVVVRIHMCPP